MQVQTIQEINLLARPLFEQYNITYAAVFGSFAKGTIEKTSDIDILVSFDGKYDLLDIIGLKQDLEGMLGRTVDLLTLNSLKNDEFGNIVKKEAQKIYEKN